MKSKIFFLAARPLCIRQLSGYSLSEDWAFNAVWGLVGGAAGPSAYKFDEYLNNDLTLIDWGTVRYLAVRSKRCGWPNNYIVCWWLHLVTGLHRALQTRMVALSSYHAQIPCPFNSVQYQRDCTEYRTLWRHEILRYKSNFSQILITCSPSELSSFILIYWRIRRCGSASVWKQYGQTSV